MTKTILTIAGTLTLTFPFLLSESNLSELPIESNNIISPAAGNISSYPAICTRDGAVRANVVSADLTEEVSTPMHCIELNCGLGIYTKHVGSEQETCSSCGSLKPATF